MDMAAGNTLVKDQVQITAVHGVSTTVTLKVLNTANHGSVDNFVISTVATGGIMLTNAIGLTFTNANKFIEKFC